MRKFLISAALAAGALTVAAPAAAQYYPAPQHYGYGHGYGYGYQHNYGQVRALQARIDQLQRHIVNLDRRNILSNREARRLYNNARDIERRLRSAARNGLSRSEHYAVSRRIARLEQQIHRRAWDGNRWGYRYR